MVDRRFGPRRPHLSQHFLRSSGLAASLATQAPISTRDLVVEIGSGRGVLTKELAKRCQRVIAVELDPRLCAHLRDEFEDAPDISVVHADFLRFNLPKVPHKIVGNIPFNRTAEIVRRVTSATPAPVDAFLILQREAAERFAGSPHSTETLPSVLLKPWWHVEIVRQLKRTDFDPPPRVDSSVLWLAHRSRPLVHKRHAAHFQRFVTDCFTRSGGSVELCLRGVFSRTEVKRLSVDLDFHLSARLPSLRFDQWLGVFRFFELRKLEGLLPSS